MSRQRVGTQSSCMATFAHQQQKLMFSLVNFCRVMENLQSHAMASFTVSGANRLNHEFRISTLVVSACSLTADDVPSPGTGIEYLPEYRSVQRCFRRQDTSKACGFALARDKCAQIAFAPPIRRRCRPNDQDLVNASLILASCQSAPGAIGLFTAATALVTPLPVKRLSPSQVKSPEPTGNPAGST